MNNFVTFFAQKGNWSLLLIRLVCGLILLSAGLLKIGQDYAVTGFAQMRIPLPFIMGPFVTLLETVGGALLIVGLLTRYLALLFTIQFLVIVLYVDWLVLRVGFGLHLQIGLTMLAGCFVLLTHGGGRYSVDTLLGWDKN